MATNIETQNQASNMPGRRPSFSKNIGQSLSAAFGKKDSYYFEIEFLSNTKSHSIGDKEKILVEYSIFGRNVNSTVRFKGGDGIEDLVSGTHISITRNGGEWMLEHLSKTNRTIINGGERVIRPEDSFKKYILQDSDTIQLAKGGPIFRFVIPRDNSIQSLKKSSRGTTFIKNLISQSIAPYKKTVRTLIGVIIALVIFGVGYAIYEHKTHQEALRMLNKELALVREGNEEQVANLNRKIEEQRQRLAEQERRRIDTVPVPVVVPGIDEMMRNQNLAADVYFIVGQAVAVIDGAEVEIPNAVWTATGFLLNDGRFVTARHCVEAWWYTSFDDTTSMVQCAKLSLIKDNVKIKSKITALSSISGRRFSFSSDQFKIDRSKDRIETITTTEDGTSIKWRFVFPALNGWDPTMFATDWACVQTQQSGSMVADAALSNGLSGQQQLLVMGFPAGLGVESAEHIEPISYQMHVSQPGIASNGCIMHSRGTDHGNSGGPIFAVKDGKLVVIGIVSRGDERSELYNWAVPISRIGNR